MKKESNPPPPPGTVKPAPPPKPPNKPTIPTPIPLGNASPDDIYNHCISHIEIPESAQKEMEKFKQWVDFLHGEFAAACGLPLRFFPREFGETLLKLNPKCSECALLEDNYDINYPHHVFFCPVYKEVIPFDTFNVVRECEYFLRRRVIR
jgi:hypothetical protein